MGLLMLVSFSCYHCTAVLSIPEEQTGISGPCPFCGTVVTSPPRGGPDQAGGEAAPPQPAPVEITANDESRPWRRTETMTEEQTVLPFRPRHMGLKAAAGVALFAGGVAGVWKIWEKEKPATVRPASESPVLPAVEPKARPAVLAAAGDEEPEESSSIPEPSGEIPPAPPLQGLPVVARTVSTAAAVPAVVQPVPHEEASLFPDSSAAGPVPAGVTTAPAAPVSDVEKELRRIVPTGGPLAAPGHAIIRFFAAKTWQERLPYTLAAQKVKPLMQAHYRTYPDGPIIPADIELTRMEPVEDDPSRHYFAFMVYFPGRAEGVPLSVEETKQGCLIEWTSFVEGKDMVLEKFCSAHRKEPGTFRVLIRRGHYFEDDVPDRESRVVFDINPPDRTGPYKVWLDKSSPVWKKTFAGGDKLPWNQVAMMVVMLQWEKTAKGVEYIRLREVAADTWHPEMMSGKEG